MLIDGLFTLAGHVCASGALVFVALLMAAWFRRLIEGAGAGAADVGDA